MSLLAFVEFPRWLAECFHGFPCPGVFIALLGFVAAGVTLRKEPSKPEKAFWLTIFFCLLVLELVAINVQRASDKDEQASTRLTEANRLDQTLANFTDLQKLILSSSKAQIQVAKNAHLPEESLKKRASQLSAQILSFLTDRKANEPALSMRGTREQMDQSFQGIAKYGTQTTALYTETFAARVIAVHDEFLRQGIRHEQFDSLYERPTNAIGIEMLAGRIGALAEKLKQ